MIATLLMGLLVTLLLNLLVRRELKPLARLLAARLLDQRRLEDGVERQSQQLRDSQRRIEVLNERLEAMRAIERSLTPRGAGRPTSP